jgi:hypothetical protein
MLPSSVRLGGKHPLRFGTGRRWLLDWAQKQVSSGLSPDVRLFAGAYAAGFLVVSLFIA